MLEMWSLSPWHWLWSCLLFILSYTDPVSTSFIGDPTDAAVLASFNGNETGAEHGQEEEEDCFVHGIRYKMGDMWIHDEECAQCTCTGHGLSQCRPINCIHPNNCRTMIRPSFQNMTCCPVCSDCVALAGFLHESLEVWEEDECTTCRCHQGRKRCQSQMCRMNCIQPQVVMVGQCCPSCPDVEGNEKAGLSTLHSRIHFLLAIILLIVI